MNSVSSCYVRVFVNVLLKKVWQKVDLCELRITSNLWNMRGDLIHLMFYSLKKALFNVTDLKVLVRARMNCFRAENLKPSKGWVFLGARKITFYILRYSYDGILFSFFYRSTGISFGLPSGVIWLCGRSGMNKYVCLVLLRLQFESFTMKKPGTRGPVAWNDSLNKHSLVSLNENREGALSF